MKYITFEGACDYAVVFPDYIEHSDIAKKIGAKIIGAGFVSIGENSVAPYSKSESLQIGPDKMDQFLLNYLFGY